MPLDMFDSAAGNMLFPSLTLCVCVSFSPPPPPSARDAHHYGLNHPGASNCQTSRLEDGLVLPEPAWDVYVTIHVGLHVGVPRILSPPVLTFFVGPVA